MLEILTHAILKTEKGTFKILLLAESILFGVDSASNKTNYLQQIINEP